MLGYEPIILQTDEFATHWHRAAEDKDIENYIAEPVSYTHLDVYKRQSAHPAPGRVSDFVGVFQIVAT